MQRLLILLILALVTPALEAQVLPSQFTPLAPCRVFDSRPGGVPLAAGSTTWDLLRGSCNIPQTANAVAANVTALGAKGPGELLVWDGAPPSPGGVTLFFRGGGADSSGTTIRLCYPVDECAAEDIAIKVLGANDTHVVIDVTGYFEPLALK